MAVRMWFSVVVLITIQQIFARECDADKIRNCNECIRCGGHWCIADGNCQMTLTDDWCPLQKETWPRITKVNRQGDTISTIYNEATVTVNSPDSFDFTYLASSKPKIEMTILNTTQTSNLDIANNTVCINGKCTTSIEAVPTNEFCLTNGNKYEYVYAKINVENFKEDITVKYHVPCACACSEKIEKTSSTCNGRGDYSCGVCSCYEGWTGNKCEKMTKAKKRDRSKECPDRGDLPPCTNAARSDEECSGNGVCGPCSCECFTDREGSQYFDKDNFCADICMTTSDCDECFVQPTPGLCDDCHFALNMEPKNESVLTQKDYMNRNIWVNCNLTLVNGCNVKYAAMRDAHETKVMVLSFCDVIAGANVGNGVNVAIPVVLGVIALVAATAAVAGYMFYKSRAPPLPMNDPHYQNIDAEDCTGENPLYKPPTSQFKNPTYGKW